MVPSIRPCMRARSAHEVKLRVRQYVKPERHLHVRLQGFSEQKLFFTSSPLKVTIHRQRRAFREYMREAAALRPLLSGIRGFISIERFESKTTPSNWVEQNSSKTTAFASHL